MLSYHVLSSLFSFSFVCFALICFALPSSLLHFSFIFFAFLPSTVFTVQFLIHMLCFALLSCLDCSVSHLHALLSYPVLSSFSFFCSSLLLWLRAKPQLSDFFDQARYMIISLQVLSDTDIKKMTDQKQIEVEKEKEKRKMMKS